ncbi:MAG TPA: SWIM zinc finger family protein [Terriglobia bacterium]|nr:SWIM zinc finger family protein [Terriglobia bacterium]
MTKHLPGSSSNLVHGKMANSQLLDLLDKALHRMAGGPSFSRGQDYFKDGRVHSLFNDAELLEATVIGSRKYHVRLWVEKGKVSYSCTCPVGEDGDFCKHCVAVALAGKTERPPKDSNGKNRKTRALTLQDVRAMLLREDHEKLVDTVVTWAKADGKLRDRLLLAAARESPGRIDLAPFRRAIDKAFDSGDFVDYYEMASYARDANEAIDRIEEILRDGHADAALELSEHALRAAERAMDSMDDSDGRMSDILERLQEVHLEACTVAKPDPVELARKLFAWELRSEWDVFLGAVERYAAVLGVAGLEAYRKLAEAEWSKVPERRPGSRESGGYGGRFRIRLIMENLARLSGDIEALVEVMARDLSSAYYFFKIAETYQEAKKYDKALEWAERGLKAFPERTDPRLREFVAEEYHRCKRHEDAMQLIWANFLDHTELDPYKDLEKHARKAGAWDAWRERALAEIRRQIAASGKRVSREGQFAGYYDAGRSLLVRIFLYEKDAESAWREAKEGGCSTPLWLELAKLREKDHPKDAIPIYLGHVEPTLSFKNNNAYTEAVRLLRQAGALMAQVGQQEDFVNQLTLIRAKHRPKRNFIKLLDQARL